MAAPPVVLHLLAADGATYDLQVLLPPIRSGRAVVRIADIHAVAVRAENVLTGGQWVTKPPA